MGAWFCSQKLVTWDNADAYANSYPLVKGLLLGSCKLCCSWKNIVISLFRPLRLDNMLHVFSNISLADELSFINNLFIFLLSLNFGTSGRRCSQSPLGGWLATTLVYCYFHHYFFHSAPLRPFLTEGVFWSKKKQEQAGTELCQAQH